MDSELYIKILQEELCQTIEFYDYNLEEIIFQQDNASVHSSNVTKDALNDLNIEVMDWPAQSPDLNPIEHYWSHVARELKRRTDILKSKEELWNELQNILKETNLELCRKLIGSMPRRVIDVIKVKGGYTRW
jgi:hypothetical protein